MSDLLYGGETIRNLFELFGDGENDLTGCLGWVLSRCPGFLRALVRSITEINIDSREAIIRLQSYEKDRGITDIEIELPGKYFIIIEAKKGWNLPGRRQLTKYARRHSFISSRAPHKKIIVLSECSREYSEANLSLETIRGIRIQPISWQSIIRMAQKCRECVGPREKQIIGELIDYLGGIVPMRKIDSNWVYVVSLGTTVHRGWGISYIDIVEKLSRYFHPVGGSGWPTDPPNYIAFRYHGELQSIHFVKGYEILNNMHTRIKEIPSEDWGPYFLYSLGPGFRPAKRVSTGNIFRNGRVWCMLDTLFTARTISEARDISQRREDKKS